MARSHEKSLVSQLSDCLPKWLYQVASPPALNERVPVAPHPHQHLMLSVFWILAILIGVWWHLIVLICISLMIYNVGHLFISLCAICISFSEVSVKILTHFQMGLFVVLLLSFKSSSGILVTVHYQMCPLKMFSFSLWLVFSFSWQSRSF